jgi:predicted MFS family arabinose efflux permease
VRDGAPASTSLGATVWWMAAGRLPATTAIRMLAPLLGVIAAGVGVSLVTAGVLVAIFEAVGLAAPAAGWLIDRLGTRSSVLLSLATFSGASLLAAVSRGVVLFAVALVTIGAAVTVYEAAATAWVASVSDYRHRASWLGRFDTAWAGGLLVGVPIVAALSWLSWRAAFLAVGIAAALLWLPLHRRVVDTRSHADGTSRRWRWTAVRRGMWIFAAFGLMAGASQLVIVVYGVWLGDRFGAVGFLFGVGDLFATVVTMRHTDRIGKARAAMIGAAVLTVAAASLLVTDRHAASAVASMLVLLGGYEFALLSTKPMLTEIDPTNRGLGIGIGFGASAAVRGLAAVAGTALYSAHGLPAVAVATAATGATTFLLLAVVARRSTLDVTGP